MRIHLFYTFVLHLFFFQLFYTLKNIQVEDRQNEILARVVLSLFLKVVYCLIKSNDTINEKKKQQKRDRLLAIVKMPLPFNLRLPNIVLKISTYTVLY